MVIAHNMAAMKANQIHKNNSNKLAKSSKKLSSGYRINGAADDAAGLAISEKLRFQIRGLNKAAKNAQDGISFVQVADGALSESHTILHRCRELAVQAANDTNTDSDRQAIQDEINKLVEELDNIANNTEFNTLKVFDGNGIATPDIRTIDEITVNVEWALVDSTGNAVNVAEVKAIGMDTSYANTPYAQFVEKAATDAVASLYNKFGSSLFNASSTTINIGLNLAGIDGAGGTLASAALSMTASSQSVTMAYTLNIDTSDYSLADFDNMTEEEKADLAATIAHEMTHLVMYDTLVDGMLGSGADSFPQWFVEGMAQTSSGDGGWVSNRISNTSTDAEIENYMSQLSSMPYGAGYLATMYLGYAASSGSNMKEKIVDGLNKIFTSLTSGKTLDEAIADNTLYTSITDFEDAFKNADSASLSFVRALLTERGNGAGSLLADELNVTMADAFAESTLSDANSNYVIKSDNTKYVNAFGVGYVLPEKQTGIAGAAGDMMLQVGALEGHVVAVQKYDVSKETLFSNENLDVMSNEKAGHSMKILDKAVEKVSTIRSYYGAIQNRLEKATSNLEHTAENTQAAESRIRDVDMAAEMVEYSKNNILLQAAQSMIAQANQLPQGVLSLLQ